MILWQLTMPIKKRIEGGLARVVVVVVVVVGGLAEALSPIPGYYFRQVSQLTVVVGKIGSNCPFADNERNPCERITLVGKVEKKGLGDKGRWDGRRNSSSSSSSSTSTLCTYYYEVLLCTP